MSKAISLTLKVLLTLVILYLGYRLYDTIFSPYFFEQAKSERYDAVYERMDEIVVAQNAFREATGDFAGSFDTLVMVLKNDSIAQIRSIGEEGDTVKVLSVKEGIELFEVNPNLTGEKLFRALQRAVDNYNAQLKKQGGDAITTYKVEDTTLIPVLATIDLKTDVDSLEYIPFSGGEKFKLENRMLSVGLGRVQVPVYQVLAFNKAILKGLDERFYEPNAGIVLGDLYNATTDIKEFEKDEY